MSAPSAVLQTRNLALWPARVPRPERAEPGLTRLADADGVLLVSEGERFVPLHSRRDPIREAERALRDCRPDDASTLFVIGFGLGYVADVLEQWRWPGTIVALEPDANSVRACLARRDWSTWIASGRLRWVWAPEYRALDALVPSLTPDRDDPLLLVNPVLARCQPAYVEEATRRTARVWFGARANHAAKSQMAGRYLLNTLRNAQAIAASGDVSSLTDRFAGLPAIVVAAGPSLDRTLEQIAAWHDQAVLVAVDTALRPLLAAGVAPDLVVAVDPTEANARHLVDLPSCESTYMVSEGSLDPAALQTFAGRQFIFRVADHHPWPWLRTHGLDRGQLRAWGSVLTTAFDLALRMGCDPIVLAGADLAFTDNRPYARGTTYEEDWRRDTTQGRRLEDVWRARVEDWPETWDVDASGARARTAPHLVAFRDWLAAEAANAEGRTVVNATGAGILHGPCIHQSTIAATLAGRPSVRSYARAALEQAADAIDRSSRWSPGHVPEQTDREWCAFAQIAPVSWRRALGLETVSIAAPHADLAAPEPMVAATHDVAGCPELSDADRRYLNDLARSHAIRVVVLREAADDLLGELRDAATDLGPQDAVAVVDAVGVTVGAQTRRAINAILCERPDIWLDYRRFEDPASRLSVLRRDPSAGTPDLAAIDLPLWQSEHAAVADSLVPLIATAMRPESVLHIGCGAGYWLRAFERAGVDRLHGLTTRTAANAVHSAVTTIEPHELADGLPSLSRQGARPFDLCLALEVPQQLPPAAHASFLSACARMSDVIVWSYRRPGTPGATPYARPLPYWSDLFWREGFVIDDGLRSLIEDRWTFPRTVYDGLVTFRRALTAAEHHDVRLQVRHRALVERLHELYEQGLWRAIHAFTLETASPPLAVSATDWWTVPGWRWFSGPGGLRRLVFRTDAARCYLTHPRATVAVSADGRPLPASPDLDTLARQPHGGWTLVADELFVKSGDGTDPRTDGLRYAILLPAFVAWAESQPLSTCLVSRL